MEQGAAQRTPAAAAAAAAPAAAADPLLLTVRLEALRQRAASVFGAEAPRVVAPADRAALAGHISSLTTLVQGAATLVEDDAAALEVHERGGVYDIVLTMQGFYLYRRMDGGDDAEQALCLGALVAVATRGPFVRPGDGSERERTVRRIWAGTLQHMADMTRVVHDAMERYPESARIQSDGLAFLCALISAGRPPLMEELTLSNKGLVLALRALDL